MSVAASTSDCEPATRRRRPRRTNPMSANAELSRSFSAVRASSCGPLRTDHRPAHVHDEEHYEEHPLPAAE